MNQISQELLKEFYSVEEQIEALEGKRNALRQKILDLHGLKAEVEKGPFALRVSSYEEERVNSKLLLEAVAKELGEEKAKELRSCAVKKISKSRVTVELKEPT